MTILANAKHEAVALAYLSDVEKIGWRAYRKVYPKSSQHTAESAFCALMKKPEFCARVTELAKAAAQGAVMTAQEVLEELTRLARANMAEYMKVGPDGDPVLNFSELTRDQTAALIEVTVEDFMDGRGEDAREVRKVKFKLASKIGALELLGKHHKLFVERHQHDFGAGVAERLAAAIARADRRGEGEPDRDPSRGGHARKAPSKGKRAVAGAAATARAYERLPAAMARADGRTVRARKAPPTGRRGRARSGAR
jgi:phage terminase small subunit